MGVGQFLTAYVSHTTNFKRRRVTKTCQMTSNLLLSSISCSIIRVISPIMGHAIERDLVRDYASQHRGNRKLARVRVVDRSRLIYAAQNP